MAPHDTGQLLVNRLGGTIWIGIGQQNISKSQTDSAVIYSFVQESQQGTDEVTRKHAWRHALQQPINEYKAVTMC